MENAVEKNQVDELLNSVSDEYLAKKKRTKIISYSVIMGIVLALCVTIIVMSCIKVDLRPSFIDAPASYNVTIKGTSTSQFIDQTNEKYDQFNEIFDNSFKTQYLTALFTGRLGGYKIEETSQPFYKSFSTVITDDLKSQLGENYVKVVYDSPRQIKKADGKLYYSQYNTDTTLTFTEFYFPLSSTDAENDLVFYLGATAKSTRVLKITVKANTYKLYKFLTK